MFVYMDERIYGLLYITFFGLIITTSEKNITGDTWKCGWDIAYRSKPKDLSSGVFDQQSVGSNPSRGTCVLKQNA